MYRQSPPPTDVLSGTSDTYSCSLLTTSYPPNLAICFNRSLIEHQWVRYAQILLIVMTNKPRLGVALCLPHWFVDDSTTQGGEGKGEKNIGNFYNKNKHNISLVSIPLPLVSLALSTTSESLNLSSSVNQCCLHRQHRNSVAASPLPQPNPPLPKVGTISAAVLWLMLLQNPLFFLAKTISLANREHLGSPSMY